MAALLMAPEHVHPARPSDDTTNASVLAGNASSKRSSVNLADRPNMPAIRPCKHNTGWRRIVRNFTPSWFAVNMGTGIVSVLLHNMPYNSEWIRSISLAFFILNIGLFAAFTIVTLMRYILYPEIWGVMIKHPAQSLFLGCIPMGFATIINMIVFVCASWGNWAIYLAWGFWWADVMVSCATTLIIPFIVVHHHKNQLKNMTAALLLPVVPVIVASASGGVVAEVLPNKGHVLTTLVVSYIIWGLGQAFAFFIMGVYFLRLQIHDLPPREVIVSVFLPIGPLGQGGFAIQQFGKVGAQLLMETNAFNGENVIPAGMNGGTVLYVVGILIAFVLWGAALGWIAFAVFAISTTRSFPFNMSWWGFTFPLGVFTTCTGLLATELSSTFFKVITEMLSLAILLLWIIIAFKTTQLAWAGTIFHAPCLMNLTTDADSMRCKKVVGDKAV